MLTDNQILRRCRRILAREGLRVTKYRGGYSVHDEDTPKEDGNLLWDIMQVVDLAEHRQEIQDEYRRERQQREREIRAEKRAIQRAMCARG